MTLILASASASRRRVLEAAGLAIVIETPSLDEEDGAKHKLREEGASPQAQAECLADLKALSVSKRREGLVIGADQMLACEGEVFDKPRNLAEARAQLQRLRGRMHELITAVAVASGNEIVWRHTDTPHLTMLSFSDDFLDSYLDKAGEAGLHSVGAYQLEGLGAQLFERIDGDFFSILGLPLLPLLAFLRERGIVPR